MKYLITLLIVMIFISCKSSKVYTKTELNNIRITDSIANFQKDILIQDYKDDYNVNENYD